MLVNEAPEPKNETIPATFSQCGLCFARLCTFLFYFFFLFFFVFFFDKGGGGYHQWRAVTDMLIHAPLCLVLSTLIAVFMFNCSGKIR